MNAREEIYNAWHEAQNELADACTNLERYGISPFMKKKWEAEVKYAAGYRDGVERCMLIIAKKDEEIRKHEREEEMVAR